jgi:membrane fusion protein
MTENDPKVLPLFRPEAVEAQTGTGLGEIILSQPISARLLSAFSLLVALSAIVFLFVGEYTRRVRVEGFLLPEQGVLRVVPPQAGVVRELRVHEGDTVAKGDVLYVLSSERAVADAPSSEARVVERQRERLASLGADVKDLDVRHRQQLQSARDRATGLQSELQSIDANIAVAEQQLKLATESYQRYETLRAKKVVSELDLERLKQAELDRKSGLENLRREKLSAQNGLRTAQLEIAEMPLRQRAERGSLERDVAALEQALLESEARREVQVTAPEAGRVAAVLVVAGQGVSPGQTMLHLLPSESALQASLYVTSASIGLIRAGQRVKLRYPAFPFERYGHQEGEVSAVATSAIRAEELPYPIASTEPVYRVQVKLDAQTVGPEGRRHALQAGMKAEADVMLDRRRLIDWMFEPLRSMAES